MEYIKCQPSDGRLLPNWRG